MPCASSVEDPRAAPGLIRRGLEGVGEVNCPGRQGVQWAALIEPIRTDRTSGAAELAKRAAMAVMEWIEHTASTPNPGWQAELKAFAFALYGAQPSMAPFFNLVNNILLGLEACDAPELIRPRLRQTVQTFLDHAERLHNDLAKTALHFLPRGSRVLTYSYSSSILAVLLEAHAQHCVSTVFCTESRPMMEGQGLARTLASAGLAVEFGVDAAASAFMQRASVVLVGADSLSDRGLVNKLGTTSLALLARDAGIPCYAIADRQKWLPAGVPPADPARREPGEEVWPAPPAGVTVWNAYFESTPLRMFSGVIGEDGLLTADELLPELQNLPIAEAWRSQPSRPTLREGGET
jgi:translation initiation factor 2B subunit (eIF-2B alpha/beta/delta family)